MGRVQGTGCMTSPFPRRRPSLRIATSVHMTRVPPTRNSLKTLRGLKPIIIIIMLKLKSIYIEGFVCEMAKG